MKTRIIFFVAAILLASLDLSAPLVRAGDKSTPPPDMVTYYFVLLTPGPKWMAEQTPETEKIQEAHLAKIRKLHDSGKLALAGPFTDNGNWRGLFILKAASVEEAKSLIGTDPAVQAGRLSVEVHPWMTQKGMLP